MNARLKTFTDKAAANLGARAQSERVMMLALGVLVLVFGAFVLLIEPAQQRTEAARLNVLRSQSQGDSLRASIEQMTALLAQDPNEVSRARLQAIVREQVRIDEEIAGLAGDLTAPEAMTELLISMLERQEGLSLLSFNNTSAVPVAIETNDLENTASASVLYEHGLTLQFAGDYFSTLQYLKFLESISASFFWDSLTITQQQWPNAEFELQIHTLSTEGGFIGA